MAALRASTVTAVVLFGAVAMLGPALIIFHIPVVPNWPYVGLSCLAASATLGAIYAAFVWRRLKRPVPITTAWVVRAFPVWVSVFALFWSYVRLTTEE